MPRILNSFHLGEISLHREVPDDSPEKSGASILLKLDTESLLITEVVIEGDLGIHTFPTVGMSAQACQEILESEEWNKALVWSFSYDDPNTNARYVAFLSNIGTEPNLAEEATE